MKHLMRWNPQNNVEAADPFQAMEQMLDNVWRNWPSRGFQTDTTSTTTVVDLYGSLAITHGVQTTVSHGDRGEARAHLLLPDDIGFAGRPVTHPVDLIGDAVVLRTTPIGPVVGHCADRYQGCD